MHNEFSGELAFTNSAFLLGEGVFTSLWLEEDKPFFLLDHLERLRSAVSFFCDDEAPEIPIEEWFWKSVKQVPKGHYRVRVNLFHTSTQASFTEKALVWRCLIHFRHPPSGYHWNLNPEVHLCSQESLINKDLPAFLKINQYPVNRQLLRKVGKEGWNEILWIDNGQVLEATTSNIFWTKGNNLYTPKSSQILAGVTRKHVLKCFKENNYSVHEEDYTVDDLMTAESIFLTSSLRGLRRVVRFHDWQEDAKKSEFDKFRKIFEVYVRGRH